MNDPCFYYKDSYIEALEGLVKDLEEEKNTLNKLVQEGNTYASSGVMAIDFIFLKFRGRIEQIKFKERIKRENENGYVAKVDEDR